MPDFDNISFAHPEFFWLLLLLPVLILYYIYRQERLHAPAFLSSFKRLPYSGSLKIKLRHLLFLLQLMAFSSLIAALARPQASFKEEKITTEGIDIVMSMDISGSMLAEDFRPNRIEAAKRVAINFIDSRTSDRIGLVIFAGESFTQVPLTTDHAILKKMLHEIQSGMVDDGTAIGMGLATAVNRLRESDAKSKVIILLTDGVNNAGFIDPVTAADIAKSLNIKIYTIGVGSYGTAPYPVQTPYGTRRQHMEVQIDEQLLRQISDMTNGRYFRATGLKQLEEVYKEIDRLEKTKIEVTVIQRQSEEFYSFAILAGLFLLLELFFRNTIFRTLT